MANRFSAASPVDYVPLDTNLILKAGLTKDAEIQKGIDDFKTKVDYLGNLPTLGERDTTFKNDYFQKTRDSLQEFVKSNPDLTSVEGKMKINDIINKGLRDPALYNTQVNYKNWTDAFKLRDELKKKDLWGDSEEFRFQKRWKDYNNDPSLPPDNSLASGIDITGYVNIQDKMLDLAKKMDADKTFELTKDGRYIITNETKGGERINTLINSSLGYDSNLKNQLSKDYDLYKANNNSDISFKDYVGSRAADLYTTLHYNNKDIKGDPYGQMDYKYGLSQLEIDNHFLNTPIIPDKPVTNEQFIPAITGTITGQPFNPQFNEDGSIIPEQTDPNKGKFIGSGNQKFTLPVNKTVTTKYKTYIDNFTANYIKGLDPDDPLIKNLQTDKQKSDFFQNTLKNSTSFNTMIPLSTGLLNKVQIANFVTAGFISGSLGIVNNRGKVSTSSGDINAVITNLGYDSVSQFQEAANEGKVLVSYNTADINNNNKPTFRITANGKDATVSTPPDIQSKQATKVRVMYDNFKQGNIGEIVYYPNSTKPLGEWFVNEQGVLEGRIFNSYLQDGSPNPEDTQNIEDAALEDGLNIISNTFRSMADTKAKNTETDNLNPY